MSRLVKIIGTALAICAIGALIASLGAQAEKPAEFTAEAYPATITGSEIKKNVFTIAGKEITCEKVSYESELKAASSSLVLIPNYEECHAGLPATITMNLCRFVFKATKTGAIFTSSFELSCPGPIKQVEIHLYQASGHTTTVCTYDIPEQGNLNLVDLENKNDGMKPDVLATLTVVKLHYVSTLGNVFSCGVTKDLTQTTGAIDGSITLKAHKDGNLIGNSMS